MPTSRGSLSRRRLGRHTIGMEILLNGQPCRTRDGATLHLLSSIGENAIPPAVFIVSMRAR